MVSRRTFLAGVGLAAVGSAPLLRSIPVAMAQEGESVPPAVTHERFLDLIRFIHIDLARFALADGVEAASYSDFETRFESVGIPWPPLPEEISEIPLLPSTQPLLFDQAMSRTVLDEVAQGVFGWNFSQILQSATLFGPNGMLRIVRGAFDQASLEAAWSTHGYERIERDGYVIHSVDPDPTFTPDTDVGRIGLGGLNNVGQVDDFLIYSGELETLVAMLDAGAGKSESLADMPGLQALLGMTPGPLSSAMALPAVGFTAIEGADPATGDPYLSIVGFLSGSILPEPENEDLVTGSSMTVAAQFPDPDVAFETARLAAIRLETERLVSIERSYASLFTGWRIEIDREQSIVQVEADIGEVSETVWMNLVLRRDLRFLMASPPGE
jgi:hypothetical protein